MGTTDSEEKKYLKIEYTKTFWSTLQMMHLPLNPHFLSLLSMGAGENFPRVKLDSAQGFLFFIQGENFHRCERSSTSQACSEPILDFVRI